jgi:hypothetical protein
VPNFTTTRTVTPAALKWLLNERAAIVGAISKALARQEGLSAKLRALQCTVERQNRLLQKSFQKNTALVATLNAVDTTIGLAYAGCRAKSRRYSVCQGRTIQGAGSTHLGFVHIAGIMKWVD